MSNHLEGIASSPLLSEQRSFLLIAQIDNATRRAILNPTYDTRNYRCIGDEVYSFFPDLFLNSIILFGAYLQSVDSQKVVHIADIGAGNARHLLQLKNLAFERQVVPHALSLHDFRDLPQFLRNGAEIGDPSLDYRQGNAENILRYFEPKSISFMMSHVTSMYFIDPLATLQACLEVVEDGGIFAIDTIYADGIENIASLIAFWQKQGIQVFADYLWAFTGTKLEARTIRGLVFRKNFDRLPMPVSYDYKKENSFLKAVYKLSNEVPLASFPLPDEMVNLLNSPFALYLKHAGFPIIGLTEIFFELGLEWQIRSVQFQLETKAQQVALTDEALAQEIRSHEEQIIYALIATWNMYKDQNMLLAKASQILQLQLPTFEQLNALPDSWE